MRSITSALLLLLLAACSRGGLLHKSGQASGGSGGSGGGGGGSQAGSDAGNKGDGRAPKPSCTFKGFANPVAYTPTAAPYSLRVADVTGDGHLDILVKEGRNGVPSLELLTNTGQGTFTQATLPFVFPLNSGVPVAADFNGDGILDLASQGNSATGIDVGNHDGVLAFDFGTGAGKLASQAVALPSPQTDGFLAVGDFDGDGRPDLAFAGYDYQMMGGFVTDAGGIALPGPEPTNFAMNVYRNTGQGHFAAPVGYATPAFFKDLVTGDFDGDGHIDIALLASTTAWLLGVFYNVGDGSFADEATFGPNPDWGGFGFGAADFNGDGIDDLATVTYQRPNASDEAIVIEVWTQRRRHARPRAGAPAGWAGRERAAGARGSVRQSGRRHLCRADHLLFEWRERASDQRHRRGRLQRRRRGRHRGGDHRPILPLSRRGTRAALAMRLVGRARARDCLEHRSG